MAVRKYTENIKKQLYIFNVLSINFISISNFSIMYILSQKKINFKNSSYTTLSTLIQPHKNSKQKTEITLNQSINSIYF